MTHDDTIADNTEQIPVLDEVLDMELDADENRRYLVLYDEDYDNLLIDAEDSVALLVDCNQAVEVLRLASMAVSDLAPEHAPDKEPIDAMIDALQEVSRDD